MEIPTAGVANSSSKEGKRTHVTLRVQRENMKDISLRVRVEVEMRKVKLAYCDQVGLNCDEVRFTYDGTKIGDHQTAADLGMEDGDVIDAWSDQSGGAGAPVATATAIATHNT